MNAEPTVEDALRAIERIVGDDLCEEWSCEAGLNPDHLTSREREMQEKLSLVYRISHSVNRHECHGAHNDWRELVGKVNA